MKPSDHRYNRISADVPVAQNIDRSAALKDEPHVVESQRGRVLFLDCRAGMSRRLLSARGLSHDIKCEQAMQSVHRIGIAPVVQLGERYAHFRAEL